MNLKTLEIFDSEPSAIIHQQILENEGIQARVFKNFSIRLSFVHYFKKQGYELQVLEQDFEKAKNIFKLLPIKIFEK